MLLSIHNLKNQRLRFCLTFSSGLLLSACDFSEQTTEQTSNSATLKQKKQALNLHVESPQWQDQIIYFLMIDRFNDGDSSNNDQGSGEFNPNDGAYYSGGDLRGITEKLDYIKQLGATSIWITPPVSNQWWSSRNQSAGYHGYWAKNFKTVDAHFGSLSDYKQLSSELHNRNMYLIQDIVTNHSGNYFEYTGDYDAKNVSQNFRLSEIVGSVNAAPTQYPFDQINLLNNAHRKSDIYHWTPTITDYNNPHQEQYYQLSGLADLNTTNPLVLKTLQDSYSYWIKNVGVDGFRIDTVKFVEHEFWNAFLHNQNGIVEAAKSTGRNSFLNFGEVWEVSAEFSDKAEQKIVSYLGTKNSPELDSIIGFPLYAELTRVFAHGRATANLGYRLRKQMEIFENPYLIPNFVDNHDTQRFLRDGSMDALKQALFVIFTIPGIPVIYQGTEQGLTETREAMFAGGFNNSGDHFNSKSEMFSFISRLSELRKKYKTLTRGGFKVIAEDNSGSGVFSFTREYQQQQLLIIVNSSDREKLVSNLDTGLLSHSDLEIIFSENIKTQSSEFNKLSDQGLITFTLPARSMIVLKVASNIAKKVSSNSSILLTENKNYRIQVNQDYSNQTLVKPSNLSGNVNWENAEISLVINGDLKTAQQIKIGKNREWQVVLPVSRLGLNQNYFTIYSKNKNIASSEQHYFSKLEKPHYSFQLSDPIGDDKGPSGNYQAPKHNASQRQMDIEGVSVSAAGDILELHLKMSQISTFWGPANGFDNVSFSLFFSVPGMAGTKILPELNSTMPDNLQWSVAHVFYGWGNSVFSAKGATANYSGEKLSSSPEILVEKEERLIRIKYKGLDLGIDDWAGVKIYLSTWDKTGVGEYRAITKMGGEWDFKSDNPNNPKIMDDIFFSIPQKRSNKKI